MQNVEEWFSRNAAHFWSVPSGFILQQIQQYCGVLSKWECFIKGGYFKDERILGGGGSAKCNDFQSKKQKDMSGDGTAAEYCIACVI